MFKIEPDLLFCCSEHNMLSSLYPYWQVKQTCHVWTSKRPAIASVCFLVGVYVETFIFNGIIFSFNQLSHFQTQSLLLMERESEQLSARRKFKYDEAAWGCSGAGEEPSTYPPVALTEIPGWVFCRSIFRSPQYSFNRVRVGGTIWLQHLVCR